LARPGRCSNLGGIGDDAGNGIAVHPGDSSVFVAGSTESVDFPTVSPIQLALAGRIDAFVARLNPAGGALVTRQTRCPRPWRHCSAA
jgi:hypothetical protein